MIVRPATAGLLGLDTDTIIPPSVAIALYTTGFRFATRYLSRFVPQQPGDLTPNEVAAILTIGLGLSVVQHCPPPRWVPSAAIGSQYGAAAAANAKALSLPEGMTVWLDLEGCSGNATAADTIAYVNAWSAEVRQAGYQPGLYVGANQPLNSTQLYWNLQLNCYWQSESIVPAVDYRGYAMNQVSLPSPVDGISLDRDIVVGDNLGAFPNFVWNS